MRNALTSLEQLIAFGDGAVTMEVAERMLGAVDSTDLADIVRTIGARDAAACFRWVAEYVETGADMAQFVANLAEHMRNMYVMAVAGPEVVLDVSEATRRELFRGAAAVRRRPSGATSGRFGGCSRRAEDVHEPAAYLRDRADAHGAPRCRCDAGGSGRACGNPGAPAGRRLCRGCRARCACGSSPRRGRPWSPLGSVRISVKRQSFCRAHGGRPKACPYGGDCLDSDSRCDRPGSGCPCVCGNRPGCRCPHEGESGCGRLGGIDPRRGRPWSPLGSGRVSAVRQPVCPRSRRGGPVSAPTEGVAPTATPVAVAAGPVYGMRPGPRPIRSGGRGLSCRPRSSPRSRTWRRCSASGPASSPR